MTDCFISYGSADADFAAWVKDVLEAQGLNVFMAGLSLVPGADWSAEVRAAVLQSEWVICLLSRESSRSPYVMQEAGIALAGAGTQVIPIVWDMDPGELPGWLDRKHALDRRGADPMALHDRVADLASQIREKKEARRGLLFIAGVVAAGLVYRGRDE